MREGRLEVTDWVYQKQSESVIQKIVTTTTGISTDDNEKTIASYTSRNGGYTSDPIPKERRIPPLPHTLNGLYSTFAGGLTIPCYSICVCVCRILGRDIGSCFCSRADVIQPSGSRYVDEETGDILSTRSVCFIVVSFCYYCDPVLFLTGTR